MSHVGGIVVELRARELAELIGSQRLDLEDAAQALGIDPGSLWAAVYRRRIPYVQYRKHKYFALGDLAEYAAARRPGLGSEIEPSDANEITGFADARTVRLLPPRLLDSNQIDQHPLMSVCAHARILRGWTSPTT